MTTIAPPHLPNYNITFEKLGVDDEEWEYHFGPVRVRIEHNPDNDPVQPFKVWYGEYDDDYETFDTMAGAVKQVERWLKQWAEYFSNLGKPEGS